MEPLLLSWYVSLIFSLCILFTSVDMHVHNRVALSKTKHEVLKFKYLEKNTIIKKLISSSSDLLSIASDLPSYN